MKNLMTRLFREEEGQGMVEYGILIAGIAVVVMVAVYVIGDKIKNGFELVAKKLGAVQTDLTPQK